LHAHVPEGFELEKVLVAKTVANKLYAAEASVDQALADASELMKGMIAAKDELNASSVFADTAIAKVAETIATLSASRSALVAAHGQLEEAKLRLGIRTKMGPIFKGVDNSFAMDTREVELRQVG
jgi:hypothetical protein